LSHKQLPFLIPYFAAFLAADFFAGDFFAAAFFAGAFFAADVFAEPFAGFASAACSSARTTVVTFTPGFYAATVTMMCASLR